MGFARGRPTSRRLVVRALDPLQIPSRQEPGKPADLITSSKKSKMTITRRIRMQIPHFTREIQHLGEVHNLGPVPRLPHVKKLLKSAGLGAGKRHPLYQLLDGSWRSKRRLEGGNQSPGHSPANPREPALAADLITASTSLAYPWHSSPPIPLRTLQYRKLSS